MGNRAMVRARVEPRCTSVRQQLALGERGAFMHADLHRHIRSCPACAEFREEVRRQSALLARLLPVEPSAALRRRVLAASRPPEATCAPAQELGTASSSQSASSSR